MTKPEKSTTGVASDSAKMETSCSFCLLGMVRVLMLPRRINVTSPFNSIHKYMYVCMYYVCIDLFILPDKLYTRL